MKKSVLIFTAAAGGGHFSIADSLLSIIKNNSPKTRLKVINDTPKGLELFYRYLGNTFPSSYATFWEWTNKAENSDRISQIYAFFIKPLVDNSLRNNHPNIIISTDPFSILPVQLYLHEHNLKIPHAVFVADPFSIHRSWVTTPHADLYLVANAEASQILSRMGVPKERIHSTGWLLRQDFYQKVKDDSHHKPTLFIGGSGDGGGNIHQLIKRLIKDKDLINKVSFTIVCGKNKLLKTQLNLLLENEKVDYQLYGYTKKISDLISQSDIVIGKPGPNLLFESIMLGKPFIATGDPLAQEVGNYEYIDKAKIGFNTTSPRITHEKILLLLQNPQMISTIKKNIVKIQSQHLNTPELVWNLLQKYL